jgi:DNA-directed RNA polymerase subunit beta'
MELFNFLKNLSHLKEFDRIHIGIASPEKIRSWSYGEIKTAETINYRTFKPENDGLFCAKIFGPNKNDECLCGKYKLYKNQGIICDKCGVEVTNAAVRRKRMGHIELAAPIVHIWYLKSLPSRIGLLLDMSLRDLERILYFDAYVVIDPGFTPLKHKQLLSETAFLEAIEAYGREFDARQGGEAIYELLRSLDLPDLENQIREQIEINLSETIKKRLIKRLMLVQALVQSHNQPEWMVLKVLPVLPPDLRPLVQQEEGGRFVSSDLNELYRRVIHRNNRTKRLLELKAPEAVIRNELRMLQEAVDALLDNGRRHIAFTGNNKQPLHSLSDMIKGKQGHFRQYLLGKRVDFSGRSVIVVEPALKLHQCGLPKEMALELFKPLLVNHLQKTHKAISINEAKNLVKQRTSEIWASLEEVIKHHPVLLNRPPTLYRLGIQAFEPILVEGKAIQLHPLVCKAFNANFDGDQMAVHLPLSIEAQLEARILMMPNRNILSPVNGTPLIVPSQEMVLGLYYMTGSRKGVLGENMVFADFKEVQRAFENGVVDLQATIELRLPTQQSGNLKKARRTHRTQKLSRIRTTVGRALLSQYLPEGLSFDLINCCLIENRLSNLILKCYYRFGSERTLIFAEQLMKIGFAMATRAGITLSIEEMIIPSNKPKLINETLAKIEEIQKQYQNALITNNQRYNKVIDLWTKTHNKMATAVLEHLSEQFRQTTKHRQESNHLSPENNLYMMIETGIQNVMSIRQLSGMCGLMAKPDGSILETPITTNFREGLDAYQYFISTHGTRKGLADTALKTANAGYLTRRLVDVAQDVIITEKNCGTTQGITLTALTKNDQFIKTFSDRILGRVIAEDIYLQKSKKPIVRAGTLLDEKRIEKLEQQGIKQIKVRSPITCQSEHGVCALCYGRDLAQGQLVHVGEAVGVIAAQSIGEAGTQLTMRTWNGGSVKRTATISQIKINAKGTAKFHHIKLIKQKATPNEKKSAKKPFLVVSQSGEIRILDKTGKEQERHKIPYGATLSINDGDQVVTGQQIAHWDPHHDPLITEVTGYIRFVDIVEGATVHPETDPKKGQTLLIVKAAKLRPISARELQPQIKIVDKKNNELTFVGTSKKVTYFLPAHTIINIKEGAKVNAGDIIARLPFETPKTRDITDGLLRVADLFEARIPKEPAILARRSGTASFGKETKTKHRFIITDDEGLREEHPIPKWRQINVSSGQHINLGEKVVNGILNPHDILRLKGPLALVKYLINEMQEIYSAYGININDKHFEVIIRQMLRTVTIIDPGDTPFFSGEYVTHRQLEAENQRIAKQAPRSGRLATWEPNLLGITKTSLSTESFISAASFMDATRVLFASALKGKSDELSGLKENVILGRLIPAGTGLKEKEARKKENRRKRRKN